uniref:Wadjet protein JetD C-terminal domain-containing protein n=1 Tax=Eubacterium plexicaudatum ASF492 TaxID=1235802 RepID=N2ADH7_9FIRM
MKRISLHEIEQKLHAETYEQLCAYLYRQIENGCLKPVKASGLNGKKPALYQEYRVVDSDTDTDYHQYEEELNYQMSTHISIDYYLRHLPQYAADREWVCRLNQYFFDTEGKVPEPVSKNERSFQIWGREKFLQQEQGKKILKRCGVEASRLAYYETSEPLAYYSSHRQTPQNLLILENKDTFYSMRRHLLDQSEDHKKEIFGISFGTLIYGAGKGILRSFQDFSFCVEPYMQAKENRIYYFGDLDYEGIGIYERLAESFERQEIKIRPFTEAYEKMLEKARMVERLAKTKEKQNRNISGTFFAYFSGQTVQAMKQLLEKEYYIPQEILNITDFV